MELMISSTEDLFKWVQFIGTNIEVGIGDAIKKALEMMNGWQIVSTAVIGIIVYTIIKCYTVSRNARKEEVKAIQETERLRITTEASKNNVIEALAVVKAVEESS